VNDDVFVSMGTAAALASELVVPSAEAMPKPPSFSHAQAASLSVGFLTAYNGLVQRGRLHRGQTVLITGASGGMGAAAIQLAVLYQCRIIACVSSADKAARCRALGAQFTVDYSTEDMKARVHQITNGKMADLIYELVGGDVFDQCVRCVAWQGTILVVGFAGGRIPTLPMNLPLVKCFSVVGVASGASMRINPALGREASSKLREWTAAGHLAPHIGALFVGNEVSQVQQAFRMLADRKAEGKVVILWRDDDRAASVSQQSVNDRLTDVNAASALTLRARL